ncbi:MAG: 23S rRNA (uracil(1939)-C(5))-methyltransferase RlmD [Firmicutes bacterium]|nr:23S rRNA (uracil(1939)-C(5))-methyltransferase RlmD [Bacillota bacterium]
MLNRLHKGDIIELRIDNLAHGGDCVAHYQGLAVFLAGGIPGEKVKARVTLSKKNYARANIVEIIEPAVGRSEASCGVFRDCGGCHLQQMEYSLQLKHKKQMIKDLFERIGKLKDVNIKSVIGTDYPYSYRNKAQFPLAENEEGEIITGFYKQGTHQLIAHGDCLIQHPLINRVKDRVLTALNRYKLTAYNEKKHQGLLRHLVIRIGTCTNQVLITLVTSRGDFPEIFEIAEDVIEDIPEIQGVLHNINPIKTNLILGKEMKIIKGQDYYIDYVGKVKFAISAFSFFQVNTLQTKKLYDQVLKAAALRGGETVVDAYCGIGTISLYIAQKAKQVYGLEEVAEAVSDARKNAILNKIDNCQFEVGRVEELLPEMIASDIKADLLIFDPPRKGLAEEVIEAVRSVLPEKIIYVSCNPATLARDLSYLKENYLIKEVQPVDMFPQTYHVETVVSLQLKEGIL